MDEDAWTDEPRPDPRGLYVLKVDDERGVAMISIPWPHSYGGPWVLRFTLAVVSGRAECVGFAVEQRDREPYEILTATVIRSISFASLLDVARRRAVDEYLSLPAPPSPVLDAAPRAKRKRQPTRWTPERLAEAAAVYGAAHARGTAPRVAVAEHFGISRDAAAQTIRRIRKNRPDLLGQTERGVAGTGRKDEQ